MSKTRGAKTDDSLPMEWLRAIVEQSLEENESLRRRNDQLEEENRALEERLSSFARNISSEASDQLSSDD
jgi:predicted RNase H-like nuclease (RuvC/YqgF family)